MDATASKERKTGIWARLFRSKEAAIAPLYAAVVAEARAPRWYAVHGVPDTINGRFDMVALVLSLVLLRFEALGEDDDAVRLTEHFIADMDGQVREIGFGDLVVGKQVGGIMAVLGGRLGAYRAGIDLPTLERTLWRGAPPAGAQAALDAVLALRHRIAEAPRDTLRAGRLA